MNYDDSDVVIIDAVRTPVGAFGGSYKTVSSHSLGSAVIKNVMERNNIDGKEISEVIIGQIMTAYNGPNPARQAAMNAGIPVEIPAYGINQLCGSGLKSICLGYQAIRNADSQIVIAGGQENMSRSAHAYPLRHDSDAKFVDTMLYDALIDPFYNIHTVNTAENIARKFSISREEQDELSAISHQKYQTALSKGKFEDEIVPIEIIEDGRISIIYEDELPRKDVTIDQLAKLRPAMLREGSVTAGNASPISDGASVVLMMPYREAKERGLEPMAAIKSWAEFGVDPSIMGVGPIPASKKALSKAGWAVEELDIIESNESFAAQAIHVNREMGWDMNKVNLNGGAIAIGHPFGASGARILTTLLHEMKRQNSEKSLATLCVGGGMGISMCLERMS